MEVGYLEAFSKIWNQSWIEWNERGPTKTFLTDFIHELSNYGFISAKDILICLVLGVAFTILRYFLMAAFFKVRICSNFKHKDCWFYFSFFRKLVSLKGFWHDPLYITILLTEVLLLKLNIYNLIDLRQISQLHFEHKC